MHGVGTIGAVYGDTAAQGDVADDRIARHRLTATSQLGHQVADALDVDIPSAADIATGLFRDELQLLAVAIRLDELLRHIDHVGQTQVARAYGDKQVLLALQAKAVNQLGVVGTVERHAGQLALDHQLASLGILLARLLLEPVLHLGPGPGRVQVAEVGVEPVAARAALLARNDLDLLTGLQHVVQRHNTPIDLGAPAAVTNFGMHAVGKVQRRSALGHIQNVTVGGKQVDTVGLKVDPQLLGQTADITHFLMPLKYLTQPGNLVFVGIGVAVQVRALVAPVRTDTQFSLFVHALGTDLHLEHLALGADYRGVQRAVAIFLRVGDIIVKLVGNVTPQAVHDAKRRVAVTHLRHQNPHRAHVIDLTKIDALALHLAPDRVDMFCPASDVGVDRRLFQRLTQLSHHRINVLLAIETTLVQQRGNLLVLGRFEIAEGEVFQLPLDMADAEAVRQRRVDVEYFAGHTVALFFRRILDRPNGAGTFSQLDQRDAHIIHQGDQHLAQVLDLRLRTEARGITRVLRHADGGHALYAIHQVGDGRAKAVFHLGQIGLALTHRAINHSGNQ